MSCALSFYLRAVSLQLLVSSVTHLYVVLVVLELTMKTRLESNSQKSSCLYILGTRIKSVCQAKNSHLDPQPKV